MRRVFVGALAVMLFATFSGCAVTEKSLRDKGMSPMTQKQLEDRYSRPVKMSVQTFTGVRGTAAFAPDGTVRLDLPNLPNGSDTGTWRIKDGKLCTKYTNLRKGEEACFSSYKTGPKDYTSFDADGSLNATSTDID